MAEDFTPPAPAFAANTSPVCHHAEPCAVSNSSIELVHVGGSSCPAGTPLTDESREAAISLAGRLVEKYMAVWNDSGCFAAHGDADRARRLMELLIAGRSPEQVARMEAAQSERMAREPGAEKGAA